MMGLGELKEKNADADLLREMIGFVAERMMELAVGAILMEQTEDWAVQRSRCVTLETLALVCDDPVVSLPAAQTNRSSRPAGTDRTENGLHHRTGHDFS